MIGGETKAQRIAAEYTNMFSRTGSSPKANAAPKVTPRKMSLADMAAADLAKRVQTGGSNRWIRHVKNHQSAHPGMSYKEAMQSAKNTYQK